MFRKKSLRFSLYLALGLMVYFPLFSKLGSGSLYHWDESRNAIHAFEMSQNGNYLVRHYLGQPDIWETKPPVLIWLQVMSFKVFGYTELGVRFPAALFGLLTIVLLYWFFKNTIKDELAGLFTIAILITTHGYINYHVTRTGDHDSILVFFLLLSLLSFYQYVHWKRAKYLYVCTIATILAVLTKSIAGLFFILPLFLYALFSKTLLSILRDKHFYSCILLFSSSIATYYLLANYYHPGYLQLVWENELLPRYLGQAGNHDHKLFSDKLYYLRIIKNVHFKSYAWLLPIAVLLILFKKDKLHHSFYVLVFITAVSYLITISFGTKNSWYTAPIYPLLAILVAYTLCYFINKIAAYQYWKTQNKNLLYASFFLLIFTYPYYTIIKKINQPTNNTDKYGELLSYLKEQTPDKKDFLVYYEWKNSAYLFYGKVYNTIYHYELQSCGVRKQIKDCDNMPKAGDQVIICNDKILQKFYAQFESQCQTYFEKCQVCEVLTEKVTQ